MSQKSPLFKSALISQIVLISHGCYLQGLLCSKQGLSVYVYVVDQVLEKQVHVG
jgi:hypothetical protein